MATKEEPLYGKFEMKTTEQAQNHTGGSIHIRKFWLSGD